MKKLTLSIPFAIVLFALSLGSVAALGQSVTIKLNELQGSGDFGTATLTEVSSNQVRIVIQMGGTMPMEHNHPVDVYTGSCTNIDPKPVFPLNAVTNGQSDTTISISMTALMAGRYAIILHESPAALASHTACGDITTMNAIGGVTGSSGGLTGGSSQLPTTGNGAGLLIESALLLTALLLTGLGLHIRRIRAKP